MYVWASNFSVNGGEPSSRTHKSRLRNAGYQELHQLVDSLMIAEDDLKSDLTMYGWYYIAELKCFVQIEAEHAS